MSKEFIISSRDDFRKMVAKFNDYFVIRENKGLPFQKIKIISKRYVKPKTSAQHAKYWKLIGLLTNLFINAGYRVNSDDVHNFVKVKSNFVKIVDGVVFPKSISDKSDEATITALSNLIEFIIEFASINFDTDLESLNNEVVG